MPTNPNVAAGIAAGVPLVGGIISNVLNAGSTTRQNRQNRQFAEDMYNRQRADALTDQKMQNEYNSPAAQMARLKAGGLNPNLVYGDGATTTAAPVRSSSFSQPDQKAPQYDSKFIGDSLAGYFDAKLKQAQTDNTRAAVQVAIETASRTAAETIKLKADTVKSKVDAWSTAQNTLQSGTIFPTVLEKAKLENAKIKADTQYTLDQNERSALSNAQSLQLGVEAILKSRQERSQSQAEIQKINSEMATMRNSRLLQDLEIDLKRLGLSWSDNIVARQLALGLSKPDVQTGIKDAFEWIKRITVDPFMIHHTPSRHN